MTPRVSLLALLALGLAGGCSKKEPAIHSEPAAARSAAPSAEALAPAPSAVLSAPSAVRSAPSASASAWSAPAPWPVVAAPKRLHQVATFEGPSFVQFPMRSGPRAVQIHRLREVMLVTYMNESAWTLVGSQLVPVASWGEHRAPGPGLGRIFSDGDWVRVIGRYPSDYWATIDAELNDGARLSMGRDLISFRYTQTAGSAGSAVTSPPTLAEPWMHGGVLTSNGQTLAFSGLKKDVQLPPRAAGQSGSPRVRLEALATLPRGDVLIAGQDFDHVQTLALERWQPGEAASEVLPLPLPAGQRVAVQATEKVTYVATWDPSPPGGRPVIATMGLVRIEGATITPIGFPTGTRSADLHLTADGTLWLLGSHSSGLYRLDPNRQELTRFELPPMFVAEGLFARDGRVAYAGGLLGADGVILSTDPRPLLPPPAAAGSASAGSAAAAGSAPGMAAAGSAAGSASATGAASAAGSAAAASDGPEPTALGPGCATPFVILFAVSKATPADFDYPATRDALLGWEDTKTYHFVEFLRRDQRTLGAKAPDAAAAATLVTRLRERIKGSSPTAVCYAPTRLVRELSFGGT